VQNSMTYAENEMTKLEERWHGVCIELWQQGRKISDCTVIAWQRAWKITHVELVPIARAVGTVPLMVRLLPVRLFGNGPVTFACGFPG
jgi:hypothetical protein